MSNSLDGLIKTVFPAANRPFAEGLRIIAEGARLAGIEEGTRRMNASVDLGAIAADAHKAGYQQCLDEAHDNADAAYKRGVEHGREERQLEFDHMKPKQPPMYGGEAHTSWGQPIPAAAGLTDADRLTDAHREHAKLRAEADALRSDLTAMRAQRDKIANDYDRAQNTLQNIFALLNVARNL